MASDWLQTLNNYLDKNELTTLRNVNSLNLLICSKLKSHKVTKASCCV